MLFYGFYTILSSVFDWSWDRMTEVTLYRDANILIMTMATLRTLACKIQFVQDAYGSKTSLRLNM